MSTGDDKAKVDLGLLEEDDEFEEFPAEGDYCKNQCIGKSENSTFDKKFNQNISYQ